MKIILFLLSIILVLVSCDDQNETQELSSNNPVEGYWDVLSDEGEILHTRVYTKQYYAYFSVINGVKVSNIDSLYYEIYGDKIIFDRYQQTFLIDTDTLWITNSRGDQTTKYIRKKNL